MEFAVEIIYRSSSAPFRALSSKYTCIISTQHTQPWSCFIWWYLVNVFLVVVISLIQLRVCSSNLFHISWINESAHGHEAKNTAGLFLSFLKSWDSKVVNCVNKLTRANISSSYKDITSMKIIQLSCWHVLWKCQIKKVTNLLTFDL